MFAVNGHMAPIASGSPFLYNYMDTKHQFWCAINNTAPLLITEASLVSRVHCKHKTHHLRLRITSLISTLDTAYFFQIHFFSVLESVSLLQATIKFVTT